MVKLLKTCCDMLNWPQYSGHVFVCCTDKFFCPMCVIAELLFKESLMQCVHYK